MAAFFAVSVGQVYQRARLGHDWNLFPFIFAIAATAENIGVAWLLYRFPEVHVQVAAIVGMISGLKFRFLWYTIVMVLVGILWLVKCTVQDAIQGKRQ